MFYAQREQERRQQHINRICDLIGLRNSSLEALNPAHLDHLIVNDAHHILYCNVPKVASTNWKRVLMVLTAGSARRDPLRIAGNETHAPNLFVTLSQLPKEEILPRLRSYTKLMFVRNPYERLLSAYRNKLEHTYTSYFQMRFGRKIIQQYRKNASAESLARGHDVTFEEFLQYVADLDTSDNFMAWNEHWRPVSSLCHPCHIDYDVVGKYESLQEDANYALWLAGVSDLVVFPQRRTTYAAPPSSSLLASYFHNISAPLISRLGALYEPDLLVFEYQAPS
ncbi:CHST13 [Cordylochernes scorpioides]|uniref:Carbohydrate sulfotransferase n=1 Tax=Cordylochernes scorpioides TaxID=51811 RepID=A0ABY6KYE7_9ARAC|nr:CHST13 [Cordylochernes scorpioides]